MLKPLPEITNSSSSWQMAPERPALAAADVHVWRISLEQAPAIVESLQQILSADERVRADRFHFEKDRRHFIVARGSLRKLLGRYLGIEPAALRFALTDHGKPYLLPEATSQSTQLKFNLSHSGGLAVYAFTTIGEIGVDVEQINPEFTGDEIARRFFSAAEIACLDQLPAEARALAFFNCWTRKEAFIKAKGTGLSLPLDQFDVAFGDGVEVALSRTRWDEGEARRWSLRTLEIGDGYAGAVALEAHDWQLNCWEIPP